MCGPILSHMHRRISCKRMLQTLCIRVDTPSARPKKRAAHRMRGCRPHRVGMHTASDASIRPARHTIMRSTMRYQRCMLRSVASP
jgi:hypothetical protein